MTQWVYGFGGGSADGESSMKNLLGGKGANLAEMSSLGLPVPPGFTITTEACVHYFSNGQSYPDALADQVKAGLAKVEQITGKTFGDVKNPLLVSVRSGARASMPGMMDTVLNLGLNDQTVEGLAALSGDRRFALDRLRIPGEQQSTRGHSAGRAPKWERARARAGLHHAGGFHGSARGGGRWRGSCGPCPSRCG